MYEKYKDKASECNWSNQKSTIAYHTSMFTKLKDIQSSDFFGNNISYYKGKNDDYNYRLAELRKQEQSLLIKLTYEKSLDNVKELLSEYDIEI